ncbi:1-aminocyclopropane-1-carboxylate oxidase homolog [Rhodamnia argentea]|uniref:1-aminocyclopropane-1-carboxylate oxidase homolog n=1 Tax=Rhodamnia argentea TaxID=178133 RepID=A0ABM3HA33_9MYRT|nr:1-aminocyclopropane-1-carboxylate oxidase homolog [Rhodamnia argentea]
MEEFSREEANENKEKYDRTCKLEAFDESKAGSRALSMRYYTSSSCFCRSPAKPAKCALASADSHLRIPITDLEEIAKDPSQCKEVVNEVRSASRTRGLFPVMNHGSPPLLWRRCWMECAVSMSKALARRDLSIRKISQEALRPYYSSSNQYRT